MFRALLDERLDVRPPLVGRDLGDQRCSGASTQNVMPKLVSGRVVYTRNDRPSVRATPSALHTTISNSAPSDRPIQLRCWVRTRLGPVERPEVVEQLLGVVGDAEVPLLQVAPLDEVAGAIAPPVDDLLVGQDGLAARAPVDRRHRLVGQAGVVQREEDRLRPEHELRVVAHDLSTPVVGAADAGEGAAQLLDPLVGVEPRMDVRS